MEETNLQLFTINEATLVRWYKNESRRDDASGSLLTRAEAAERS